MTVPTIRVWQTPGEGDVWMAFSDDLTRYVGVGDDAGEALEWWWLDWAGEWMQDTTIRLTPVGKPGFYGADSDGVAWMRWQAYDGPSIPCSVCGTHIIVGYRSSVQSGSRTVCVRHIEWGDDDK